MLQVLLPSIEGAMPILPRGKLRYRAARQHSLVELQTLAFPLCSLLRTYPLPSLRALGNSPGTGSRGILPTGPGTACPPFIGAGRRLGIKSRAGLGALATEGGRGGGLTPPEDAPGGQQGGWGMGRASSWPRGGKGFNSPHPFPTVWPWTGNFAASPSLFPQL